MQLIGTSAPNLASEMPSVVPYEAQVWEDIGFRDVGYVCRFAVARRRCGGPH